MSPFNNDPPIWPFNPDWQRRVTDRREWRTDLIRNPVAAEQRRALRRTPRRTFEFSLLLTNKRRAVFDNVMRRFASSVWLVPVWHDARRLIETAVAGSRVIRVDSTADFDGGDPARGVVLDTGTLAAEEVYPVSLLGENITLRDPLSVQYTTGARFYPVEEMILAESPAVQRLTDDVWTATVQFLSAGSRLFDSGPPVVVGPIVQDGLTATAFGSETVAGQTRTHAKMIATMLATNGVLRANGNVPMADVLRDRALVMADAMIGPLLRQEIVNDIQAVRLPNGFYAAKGDIQTEKTAFDVATVVENSSLRIRGGLRGRYVTRVFSAHPAAATRVSDDPNSAAVIGTTRSDVRGLPWQTSGDDTTIAPLPGGFSNGQTWALNYAYEDGSFTPMGQPYTPRPVARFLTTDEVVFDTGSFDALLAALEQLIAHDPRSAAVTAWTRWRDGLQVSIEKANRANDGRWIIQARPGDATVPPDGFFCGADHPSALTPIGAGLKQSWKGHSFWRRDTNGDVFAVVPSAPERSRVRYGRVFRDKVRLSTPYQSADHFLYVSMSCSIRPSEPDQVLVFVSSSDTDDDASRWWVNVAPYAEFVAGTGAGSVVNILVPVDDFRRLTLDANGNPVFGSAMPAGQRLRQFGVEVRSAASYQIRIREMRFVGGVDPAWTTANLTVALRGTPMPYSPGAMQNRIAFNPVFDRIDRSFGVLTVRDQLLQAWQRSRVTSLDNYLAAAYGSVAQIIARAPVLDGAGATQYPILANTSEAVAKARIAVLNEQGLLFLRHAQEAYVAHGGAEGPMVPALVRNYPETTEVSGPAPHQWVYADPEDPDANRVDLQALVVASVARVAWTASQSNYLTVRQVAWQIAVAWLSWLNTAWDGVGAPPGRVWSPAVSAPTPEGHNPLTAACALSAAILIRNQTAAHASVCDAIMLKSWEYLESMFVPSGPMAGTWSPDPTRSRWGAEDHAGVMQAMLDLHALVGSAPSGMPTAATIRDRLTAASAWIDANTRGGWTNTLPDEQASYGGYTVLTTPPNFRDAASMDYETIVETIDTQVGPIYRVNTADRTLPAWQYTWFLRGRESHAAFTRFLNAVKGRAASFWLPTFANDLQLVEPVTGTATDIVVRYAAVNDGDTTRDTIMVQMRDGTQFFRRIVGGAQGNSAVELISIDAPFGVTLTPANVLRISYMVLSRLDQDSVEITHETDAVGVSTASAMVREAPPIRVEVAAFNA